MDTVVTQFFDDLINLGIDCPRLYAHWFKDHYPGYDVFTPLSIFTDYLITKL